MSHDYTTVDVYPAGVQPGDGVEVSYFYDGKFRTEVAHILYVRTDFASLRVALGFYPQADHSEQKLDLLWLTFEGQARLRRRVTASAPKPLTAREEAVEMTVRMNRHNAALIDAWAFDLGMTTAALIELALMAGSRLLLGENLPKKYIKMPHAAPNIQQPQGARLQ